MIDLYVLNMHYVIAIVNIVAETKIAGPSVTLIAGKTFTANRSLPILSDILERKVREI